MRKTITLTIAAAIFTAPAYAQDANNVAANAGSPDSTVSSEAPSPAPDNGLVTDPAALPVTTDPMVVETTDAAAVEDDDDRRFPWGVLGLLGLLGLLGRSRSRATTTER